MGQAPQYSGRNVYWCSTPARERACIQLTGRSVEIILFIAIFQACSTAKKYTIRTFKLFAVATIICTATLYSSESGQI